MHESGNWWVDGVRGGAVDVRDRGLAYGDGVFETMRVEHGRVRLLARHLDRLERGAARLGISPPERAVLVRAIQDACTVDDAPAVLKLIVTRGDGSRGYRLPEPAHPRWILTRTGLTTVPAALSVRWCTTQLAQQPALAGLKHLNRLEQVLARAEWGDEWDDGLMCDTGGTVIAATRANLFIVTDDVLYTPALERCGVAGIMREMVCEAATSLGIPLRVETLDRAAVEAAAECFLSNAVHGVMPVARLEESRWQAPGQVTRRLAAWVAANV